jgi:hypothetical protein
MGDEDDNAIEMNQNLRKIEERDLQRHDWCSTNHSLNDLHQSASSSLDPKNHSNQDKRKQSIEEIL